MIRIIFRKYIVEALSHMALGLFCSLILGLIIGQISKIPGLDFLGFVSEALSPTSPELSVISSEVRYRPVSSI